MVNTDNVVNQLKKFDEYTDKFTEYVYALKARSGDKNLDTFSEMRNIPIEEVIASDIFYIEDATEMLLPRYLGDVEDFGVISPTNKKPIFHNRYVMPIKDVDGRILNLVGYSKTADERYVYGTAKYYRRRATMYGLENLQLAYERGYAILTEGITDTIRVRSLGDKYKVSFANCGTHSANFIMKQLNRCGNGLIKVPDRDAPGKEAAKGWKCYRSVTLNTFVIYKDIDEMCRDSIENIEVVKEGLDNCIEWVLSKQHFGRYCENEELTLYV